VPDVTPAWWLQSVSTKEFAGFSPPQLRPRPCIAKVSSQSNAAGGQRIIGPAYDVDSVKGVGVLQ
jgi:hypothetical protein